MDQLLRALTRKYQLHQDPNDAIKIAQLLSKITVDDVDLFILMVFYGENAVPNVTVHASREGVNRFTAELIMEDCSENTEFFEQSNSQELMDAYMRLQELYAEKKYNELVDIYLRRPLLNTLYIIELVTLHP